jgi:hypothetical protein
LTDDASAVSGSTAASTDTNDTTTTTTASNASDGSSSALKSKEKSSAPKNASKKLPPISKMFKLLNGAETVNDRDPPKGSTDSFTQELLKKWSKQHKRQLTS